MSAELRRDSGIVGLQTLLAGWARERSSHLRAANLCGLAQATLNQLAVPDRTVVETADETLEQLTEQLRRASTSRAWPTTAWTGCGTTSRRRCIASRTSWSSARPQRSSSCAKDSPALCPLATP